LSYATYFDRVIAQGPADNLTGGLAGNAHGRFTENGFPAYYICSNTTITFTLTPHR
jgi:hypothetical protein